MVVPGSELIMAVEAPGVGAGTWAWGNRFLWGYEPQRDDPVIEATVAAAVAAGVRFFDSADSYGTGAYAGRSERLLGQAIAALPLISAMWPHGGHQARSLPLALGPARL